MAKIKTFFVLLFLVEAFVIAFLLKNQMYGSQNQMYGSQNQIYGLQANSKKINSIREHLSLLTKTKKLFSPYSCTHVWQDKYIKLHKEILQSKRSPSYLVFDCGGIGYGCGGYGNRINAISSIFLLAVLTNRAFLINWKGNVSILDYLQPKNINWDYTKVDLNGLTSRHHFWARGYAVNLPSDTVRFQGTKVENFMEWFQRTNFMKFFTHQVEKITSQWYFVPWIWENRIFMEKSRKIAPNLKHHLYSFIGCAYDFLFQRTPRFEKLLQEAKQNLNWENNVLRIGIHFRAGDFSFKNTKSNSSVFVQVEKYFTCAKRLEKRLETLDLSLDMSSLRWFLATDNIEVKQYAKRNYPNKVIALGNQVEHIYIKEPSRAGLEGVLLDNVLLSECDFLILSYSTFSSAALGMRFHSSLFNGKGYNCIY